jgi:hypothetical protein
MLLKLSMLYDEAVVGVLFSYYGCTLTESTFLLAFHSRNECMPHFSR